ncbi:two-component system phosphate regulon response regulator OmpR [Chelatococcus caeni]|uniref:Regulatory protein VirG n=1 Tax=Chelatococcus caeni TaxID=1348468 RepID=A0A840C2M6_9HYPH|nr:two-component system phosphate regulon response regulator OmpR [Chelatococcus caeni]
MDDEAGVRETVSEFLASQGFAVRAAGDGRGLDQLLGEAAADLLLVDVNMPGEDGFSIARRVRATTQIPIIMLTAAGDIVDRVVGLELGADDYVTKPFDLRELKARIRAVLRRHGSAGGGLPEPAGAQASLVRFGTVLLDLDAHCLVRADGAREMLTAMEFDLMHVFLKNPNRVLTRDRLLDLAHHRDNEPFDRSIDVRVTRLRRKVEADPANPKVIKTVRGVGYMFSPGGSR